MREIKFRAWHKENKKMWRVLVIDWNYQTMETTAIPGQGITIFNLSDVQLMQFTGLKDKNGKEIYEGDICKDKDGELREIIWWEFGWYFKYFDVKGRSHSLVLMKDVEVIGNIYENSELLK